ncbi:hypothetical protein [Acuticoccus mangrovi]|uniref:Uncharacterized protein n=1 Tax=Acuticoccus mangrovi TaxID=2796142 RepID=A0A934ITQ7_9HYPH|nr:hypothetical protein [Acuticoccus mangrovi]MBJ3778656.1 hypothetical protein [Acuticoccus mangrovi]
MMQGLTTSLTRLETLIDGAIAALEDGGPLDDGGMADAKGRALLELSRYGRPPAELITPEQARQIRRVREKLARESRLLGVRLEAAEVVSSIVAEAVMADEWDGTYGPRPALQREKRS